MRQTLLQNIDTPNPNPLLDKLPKSPIKIPKNPKVIALIIMSGIISLLLIASIFVRQSPKNPKNTPVKPSIIPTATATPNPIPTQYIDQFSQIDKLLDQNLIVDPPQIDSTIGL